MVAAVVMCTAIWAGAVWIVLRCRRIWRNGADQLWNRKWDAMSGALACVGFAVMSTVLLRLPVDPLIFFYLATPLGLGSIACAVAKKVAMRRDDSEVRAMRTELGLPTERRLRRPMTVGTLWCAAGVMATIVWAFVASATVGSAGGPAATGDGLAMEKVTHIGAGLAFGFVILGVLHACVQEWRLDKERRRVRTADQRYLSDRTTSP
ncbi:hypothetical protein [Streptomyces chryseus]|uniref:Uncharacterized protein n=1 Tax=Streptomyces chryseus TaxID=68186 RepID=A0ABQ3EHL4_9ACTN|nr:hypothetical protein [Streptomyces chryseus]GHB31061.1 hypothetical protein GCM10010346_63040 [Streptomyces chryseus]